MKYLILGPCAMGIFSMLGTLKKIESQLDSIEEIAGSSAGSLIGFLLILGKSVDEILDILLQLDIQNMTSPNLKNALTQFGFVDHGEFQKVIKTYCSDLTFLELFEQTNKKFYVSSYCVNKATTDYFSVDSHPDMIVSDALCMSISVPFIFSAFEWRDFHYIDGGTLEEIPGLVFLNKNQDEVLVIKVYNTYRHYEKITKIKTFIELLLNQVLNNRIEYKFKNTININLENVNIFNFNMTYEEKIKLFISKEK
jgi:predicted acylesterase/phospholipase RssA